MLKKLTKSNSNGEVRERIAEAPKDCWFECKGTCPNADVMVAYLTVLNKV